MPLTNLPHDILYLILKATAHSSELDLHSLATSSRQLYTAFRTNEANLLIYALETSTYNGRYFSQAFWLSLSSWSDFDGMVFPDKEEKDSVVTTTSVEHVRRALRYHRRLVRFVRFIHKLSKSKLDKHIAHTDYMMERTNLLWPPKWELAPRFDPARAPLSVTDPEADEWWVSAMYTTGLQTWGAEVEDTSGRMLCTPYAFTVEVDRYFRDVLNGVHCKLYQDATGSTYGPYSWLDGRIPMPLLSEMWHASFGLWWEYLGELMGVWENEPTEGWWERSRREGVEPRWWRYGFAYDADHHETFRLACLVPVDDSNFLSITGG